MLREGFLIPTSGSDAETRPSRPIWRRTGRRSMPTTPTVIGETLVPIDALDAYTQETNGANLQADAAVFELRDQTASTVDLHLSGAMSNRKVAEGATPTTPVELTKGDMFTLMPYENSLVVFSLNGPEIKRVLERGYRNWWYFNSGVPLTVATRTTRRAC